MGKHLISSKNSTVQFHDNHPGCMWGILHILNYHHWHNIRNVFPLTKHYRGRHAKSYKRKRLLHNHVEDQQIGVAEGEPLLGRQFDKKWSDTSKSSPKSSNKGIHSENMSKENSKGWFYSFNGELLHVEKDGKIAESTLKQKLTEAKKLNRDISIKSKRHGDVLKVLGVDKDLLLKLLQDLDVGRENLKLGSNDKARLTKSGSVPQILQMRSFSPITFEHKQNEVWPLHKGGKDISYVKPMKQKQSLSSSSSNSQGLNRKGWNQSAPYRFKVIKQKIKHALVELKKSGYQTSVEANHHRANDNGAPQSLDGGLIQEYIDNGSSYETNKASSEYDSSICEIRSMRRTSSLNESLDRYTQLFEQSFSKDIKLPNEDTFNMSVCPPKASRRNLSLPNLDSLGFLILHEALSDARMTVEETDIHVQRKSASLPLNKDISLDPIIETEMEEIVDSSGNDVKPTPLSDKNNEKKEEEKKFDYMKNTQEPALEDGSSSQEQLETRITIYPRKEAMETLETSCGNNKTSHAEGRELNARGSNMDDLETDLHSTKIKSDKGIVSDFEYVKDVLEFLGFMGNGSAQMWHTLDQSLKPSSLLMELDKSWFHEIEFSGEENLNTNHHLLLYNVVKEVLLEMYETSPTYFPFSFKRCLIPMLKGNHLLNEVWTIVNSYLSLRPELDQTLDDVVGRDLAKSKGWMNLQQEEERVALELEDMILMDLLDEVIFS